MHATPAVVPTSEPHFFGDGDQNLRFAIDDREEGFHSDCIFNFPGGAACLLRRAAFLRSADMRKPRCRIAPGLTFVGPSRHYGQRQQDAEVPVVEDAPLQGPFAFRPGFALVAGSLPVPMPVVFVLRGHTRRAPRRRAARRATSRTSACRSARGSPPVRFRERPALIV